MARRLIAAYGALLLLLAVVVACSFLPWSRGLRPLTFLPAFIMVGALPPPCGAAGDSGGSPCFEEMSQSYSWDDQGLYWRSQKGTCPGEPPPSAWQDRKIGGRIEIRVSGKDASVVEETYAWAPRADTPPGQCPIAYRTTTRRTRIAKDGVLYDIRKTDDQPAVSSQRTLHGTQQISFSGISTIPPADSPDFKQVDNETIAGQPCVRVVSTSRAPGAATTTLCVYLSPRSCPRSHYLQQLEQKTVAPDGTVVVLGHTSELRIGKIGEVLPKNSIVAP